MNDCYCADGLQTPLSWPRRIFHCGLHFCQLCILCDNFVPLVADSFAHVCLLIAVTQAGLGASYSFGGGFGEEGLDISSTLRVSLVSCPLFIDDFQWYRPALR